MNYSIVCTVCGKTEKRNIIECTYCKNSLEIKYSVNNVIKTKTRLGICLPFSSDTYHLFPNSATPVVPISRENIFAKLEYCGLSGSSKDREAFVEITMAKHLKYNGIIAASTGNMGGALSSLCALLNYPCYIFLPNDTSKTKVKQIRQFGARIKKINGIYDDIIPIVKKYSNENNLFLASLQAFRFEGYKMIAYELYNTFKKKLPKNIIVPLGDGTTFVGVWKGFLELHNSGLIEKIPRFIGVQAEGCSPIVTAFIDKSNALIPPENPRTIAKAIRIANPLDGLYALKIAKLTRGEILSYSDEKIVKAQKTLLNYGVNAEYASALTYCPVMFDSLEDCVILITGSGFKN